MCVKTVTQSYHSCSVQHCLMLLSRDISQNVAIVDIIGDIVIVDIIVIVGIIVIVYIVIVDIVIVDDCYC